jgi:[protein-PII] uridylyltransferase
MHGRLAALSATRDCLDLDQIRKLESDGVIELDGKGAAGEISKLRDYLRSCMEKADTLLAERFWSGEDVVQLVHSRAWVMEQLLLLAWRKLVAFKQGISLVAVGGYGRGELHPASDIDLPSRSTGALRGRHACRLARATRLWPLVKNRKKSSW